MCYPPLVLGGTTTDGALIILASGSFDSWSNSAGYAANYSNLYRISATEVETGVGEVKTENGNVKGIYDFQGRKVDTPSKGLYIIDGKKVLVK